MRRSKNLRTKHIFGLNSDARVCLWKLGKSQKALAAAGNVIGSAKSDVRIQDLGCVARDATMLQVTGDFPATWYKQVSRK